MVLVCQPNGVASLGDAVWGLGLGMLDGVGGIDVFRCLLVHGRDVCP